MNSESQISSSKTLKLWFDHGLGDCVHFAHVLQLYRNRGWNLEVHYERNKAAVWEATGIRYTGLNGASRHDWAYLESFNRPIPGQDYSGNKVAGNLGRLPLLPLDEPEKLWEELCESICLEGCLASFVRESDRQEADAFLKHLPEPIILLHTTGTNLSRAKNLPDRTVKDLYVRLLERSGGAIVLLDWDNRVPRLAHCRARHLKQDWGHIDLYQLGALFERASLLIGVDSGPYHFSSLTHIPTIGVFHEHYPSCVALPRRRTLNMTRRSYRQWNISRRRRWNIVEYAGMYPTADEISRHAVRMLEGPRYLLRKEDIAHDVQLQQWTREWCRGSTSLSPLADRNLTFDALFQQITRRAPAPVVVETGCIRSPEDWRGAGNSTYLFAALLSRLGGGELISIDSNPDNSKLAHDSIADWNVKSSFIVEDSATALQSLQKSIDLLYLDSMDVDLPGHEQHALHEVQAAESKMSKNSMIVIDDTVWEQGWKGKGALAAPYLLNKGWGLAAVGYQVVLSR